MWELWPIEVPIIFLHIYSFLFCFEKKYKGGCFGKTLGKIQKTSFQPNSRTASIFFSPVHFRLQAALNLSPSITWSFGNGIEHGWYRWKAIEPLFLSIPASHPRNTCTQCSKARKFLPMWPAELGAFLARPDLNATLFWYLSSFWARFYDLEGWFKALAQICWVGFLPW